MWRPWGEIGALAAVMTAMILTGGIDLSVGSTVALCSVTLGHVSGNRVWPSKSRVQRRGWPSALLAGAVNGTADSWPESRRLVATLATMATYAGLAMALSRGQRVAGLPEIVHGLGQGQLAGRANAAGVVSAACALWRGRACMRTRWGRYLFAIGENRLAAEFAAVPVHRVRKVAVCRPAG